MRRRRGSVSEFRRLRFHAKDADHAGARRQSRRDRAAHHPRLPRGRTRGGRRVFRGRPATPHVRAADQAVAIGAAAPAESYLRVAVCSTPARRRRGAGDPPRLRLPRRAGRFAEAWSTPGWSSSAHRGRDPRDGRQDRGAAPMRGGGRADRARAPRRRRPIRTRRARSPGDFGYPVLVKAAAGGGGKGMRVVRDARPNSRRARERPRREAKKAFGDAQRVPREVHRAARATSRSRCSADARHDASTSANASARCSAAIRRWSRRRRRVAVTPALREQMGETAVRAARGGRLRERRHLRVPARRDGAFYFLEMNTRLQVEHPVTELVYGIDLVRGSCASRAGRRSRSAGAARRRAAGRSSVASRARIPPNGFLPSTGRVSLSAAAGRTRSALGRRHRDRQRDHSLLRLDARQADRVGPNRARGASRACTGRCWNSRWRAWRPSRDFHLRVMEDPEFRAGAIDIQWLERRLDLAQRRAPPPPRSGGRRRRRAARRGGARHAAPGRHRRLRRRARSTAGPRARRDALRCPDPPPPATRSRRPSSTALSPSTASPPAATGSRAPTAWWSSSRAPRPVTSRRSISNPDPASRAGGPRRSRRRRRSASRRACPHYTRDRCGGCQLQHLSSVAQLAAKSRFVRDAMRRIGRRDVPIPDVRPGRMPGVTGASSRSRSDAGGRLDRAPSVRRARASLRARRLPDRGARGRGVARDHGRRRSAPGEPSSSCAARRGMGGVTSSLEGGGDRLARGAALLRARSRATSRRALVDARGRRAPRLVAGAPEPAGRRVRAGESGWVAGSALRTCSLGRCVRA